MIQLLQGSKTYVALALAAVIGLLYDRGAITPEFGNQATFWLTLIATAFMKAGQNRIERKVEQSAG